jgi:hypothetical protein
LRRFSLVLFLTLLWLLCPEPAAAQSVVRVDDSVNDGLAAHWKFDEPAATTAREVIVGANGTLVTGATMTFGPLPPAIAAATLADPAVLALDGAAGRVDIADNTAINAATAVSFTVALWVRRDAADIDTASTLYDSGTQAAHWYVGFLSDNKLTFTTNGIADFPSTHVVTDTSWHHVAFVRSSSGRVAVYLDGVAAPALNVGPVAAPSGPKIIGNKQALTTPLDGHIDDLRIYNRQLSSDEVQRLAQGKGCVTDGATWQTAMRELQCALAEATSGAQIWIGEGVYRTGLYRFLPFILKNGVDLYGGFRGLSPGGNESALAQRPAFDPSAPLTTLSGDILGNDLPASFSNYGDNNSVVLFAPGGVAARVDGLRVQGGNADGAAGGLSNNGGGLRAAPGSAVTVINVVFFANKSKLDGGAVFSQAPLQVTAASFVSNTSTEGDGGALAITATLALTNSTFLSNTAAGDGGAVLADAPATVTGGLFRSNRAAAFYGGAIAAQQPLTVSQTTFVANVAGFGGGAIAAAATAQIVGATFQENRALIYYGGAIDASGPLMIQSSTFLSNTASFGGGAVASQTTAGLTIDSTLARYNRVLGANCLPACSHGAGGAIYAAGAVTLTASTLTDNFARLNGGALASVGNALLISSTFSANWAAFPVDANNLGQGGAIHAGAVVADSGGRFERNQAPVGGAVYIDNGASGVGIFTGTVFYTNTAISHGGGLYATGPVTLTGASFVSNTATAGDGGGLYAAGRTLLAASYFERNHAGGAQGDGGALYVQPGVLIAAGNVYTANSAGRFGGAVLAAGELSAEDRFLNNQAGGEGSALLAAASMTVTHAVFDGNRTNLSGAIVTQGPGDRSQLLQVFDSLFTRNQRSGGGGAADIRVFSITGRFVNNTFADPAPGSTPAIQAFRSTITVTNNIFANYDASVTESSVGGTTTVQADYNLFFAAPLAPSISPGAGNLTADPQFVNPAAGDYRVQFGSPAIDAGADGALGAAVTQDLAGKSRFVDILAVPGAVIGGAPQVLDLGAYEFQNQVPVANAGGPYVGAEGSPVPLDGSSSADDGGIATYAWDCTNDGGFEATSQAPTGVSCTYPDDGAFTLRLQVTDTEGLTDAVETGVTIANVAPDVTAPGDQNASIGQAQSFALGSFVDPGPDAPWQVTVDWGDDQPDTQFEVAAPGMIPAQGHGYASAGTFQVTVTVADKDNGSQARSFQVSVAPIEDGDTVFLPLILR